MQDSQIVQEYLAMAALAHELKGQLTIDGIEFVFKGDDGVEEFRCLVFAHMVAFMKGAVYGYKKGAK